MTSIAVVLVDPLNDFLHIDGKLHESVKASMEEIQTVKHLQQLVTGARAAGIPIFYALHQQTRDGIYNGWQHMNRSLRKLQKLHAFREGTFGAQVYEGLQPLATNGDVTVSRHWNSRYV